MSVNNAQSLRREPKPSAKVNNAYFTYSHIPNNTKDNSSLNAPKELRTRSCSPALQSDINANNNSSLPWSTQCASPSTPLLPHIPKTPTVTLSATLPTPPSHQLALSTLPLTTTSTTNTTTSANAAPTTSVRSMSHLICSSAATSTTSTTSTFPQVQNINTITSNALNKQENLKRNRDRQSPNNSNEQSNANKKYKNKTQISVQKTLKEYWLDKPNSSNRFELLAQEAEENELHTDSGTETKTKAQIQTEQRKLKPPPIYVQNVENVHALTTALNSLANTKYELKALSTNEVKIQPQESLHYTNILKLLKDKETKYYTFRPKDQRGFKVILRNVHHATDKNEIIMELAELGHEVLNIHNIQRHNTKQPLPLFAIELKQQDNNKEIYKIVSLLHCRVTFEPPHQKRTIPQCTNCQKYGHTKNYCTKDPVCVKCAGRHNTLNCKINNSSNKNQIKCALCGENHTANYKGCMVYKALQIQKFPTLRKKELPTTQTLPTDLQHNTDVNKLITPEITYAEALNKNMPPSTSHKHPSLTTNACPTQQQHDLQELKQMMKQLVAQMTNMMNIITILVTKLDKQ